MVTWWGSDDLSDDLSFCLSHQFQAYFSTGHVGIAFDSALVLVVSLAHNKVAEGFGCIVSFSHVRGEAM